MLTKSDFLAEIENTLGNYPDIEVLYRAGDPRIRQNIEAIATMLAMVSAQLEVAQAEVFEKTRESTILADAALRGLVPQGVPARARIRVENANNSTYTVETGRTLVDAEGRIWLVEVGARIRRQSSATIEAIQRTSEEVRHTVTNSIPFYAIEIPESDDGSYLSGVALRDDLGDFRYSSRYVNTFAGDRVFHVEADDRGATYVRLGFKDVVGVQPEEGQTLTLTVYRTMGEITLEPDTPMAFEHLGNPAESRVSLSVDALLKNGQNPLSISTLAELTKYPSVYDDSAVFLGEFDFLVRRNFPNLSFLSVWNETTEEQARGPSIQNINCLFVACAGADEQESVKQWAEGAQPEEIQESQLTETQKAIRQKILEADDSYRVRFFTPMISKISVTIRAQVSSSYVASDIKALIESEVLKEAGKDAADSRKGQAKLLYRRVYQRLRENIPALAEGVADLQVQIQSNADGRIRPEVWQFVDETSLSVEVETLNIAPPTWGG